MNTRGANAFGMNPALYSSDGLLPSDRLQMEEGGEALTMEMMEMREGDLPGYDQ